MTADESLDADGYPCPYCDRREVSETLRTLHVGEQHWDRCTDAEREAYRDAYEAESEALWTFRLKAVALLVALYFGFLFTYSIVG